MTSLEESDKEAAAVAVAPRVTLANIEAAIDSTSYAGGGSITGNQHDDILTICLVKLKNGWVVVGKSAPASPENFNQALGEKLAREDCIRQLWPLMGFALREQLSISRMDKGF